MITDSMVFFLKPSLTHQGDITKLFFLNRQTEHFVSKPGFLEISRDLAGLTLAGRELKLKLVQEYQQV